MPPKPENNEKQDMPTILPLEVSLPRDTQCHLKAKERGQKTFTIVEQDVTGSIVICEWIKLNIETAPAEKLREALEDAIAFRSYPRRKHAD